MNVKEQIRNRLVEKHSHYRTALGVSLSDIVGDVLDILAEDLENVARSHDELARRYPGGPDRAKAEGLRRFADAFMGREDKGR